ncbi:MAG: hypothetical protein ABIK28_18310, partial [Planctomycetota bacterium]
DKDGDYRLHHGFDTITHVFAVLKEKADCFNLDLATLDDASEKGSHEGITRLEEKKDWVFHAEKQALHLIHPLDLRKYGLHVFGVRKKPWVYSLMGSRDSDGTPRAGGISPDTVSLTINDREAEIGEDIEVDYANGFVRLLKGEDCVPETRFQLFYAYCPDPENPEGMMGMSSSWGGKKQKAITGPGKKASSAANNEDHPDPFKVSPVGYWKTDDSLRYIVGRPLTGEGIKLSLMNRSGPMSVMELVSGKDFRFDTAKQEIVFSSDKKVDFDKKSLLVSGIPIDNRTFQFPGALHKVAVRVAYEGEELEEDSGFTVDYDLNTISLLDRVICDRKRSGNAVQETVYRISIIAGDWQYKNYE